MLSMQDTFPVAIIGAGPVGLAAAAHLIERGETPVIFETGAEVASSIRQWAHVRMFSPWQYTVDSASVRLLERHGWQMPPQDALPTGGDLIDLYLHPFAELPEVQPHLHLNARVIGVSRRNTDKLKDAGRTQAPFVLHIAYADGHEARIEARAVIDASGTWRQPNPLGADGFAATGERQHHTHIQYGIPNVSGSDKSRYANRRVLVVGSGHSAINALLDLARLKTDAPQTQILWAMRGSNLARVYGGGEGDTLPARAKLGTNVQALVDSGDVQLVSPFRVVEVRAAGDGLAVTGETDDGLATLEVDEIIGATGSRPDLEMLREMRLSLDPALESVQQLGPMIDPNIHSCGTVPPHGEAELRQPEKDFYIVGMKSYGRAPTFLLATGYEQVRSVVAALTGDWEAARNVQLVLPETGVCSSTLGGSCCTTLAAEPALLSLADIPTNGTALQPLTFLIPQAVQDDGCADGFCSL
jgi:hypothetical protein